jgi:hypothetical protein
MCVRTCAEGGGAIKLPKGLPDGSSTVHKVNHQQAARLGGRGPVDAPQNLDSTRPRQDPA